MMEKSGFASQTDHGKFEVRSQTDPTKLYLVSITGNGLVCECKDHATRETDCKHIKIILQKIKKKSCYSNQSFKIMERSKLKLCKYCDSGKIIKKGMRKTKKGNVQIFKCKDYKKRFAANFGFEKMRYEPVLITRGLQMYYSGMSVRDIADCFELEEIEVKLFKCL